MFRLILLLLTVIMLSSCAGISYSDNLDTEYSKRGVTLANSSSLDLKKDELYKRISYGWFVDLDFKEFSKDSDRVVLVGIKTINRYDGIMCSLPVSILSSLTLGLIPTICDTDYEGKFQLLEGSKVVKETKINFSSRFSLGLYGFVMSLGSSNWHRIPENPYRFSIITAINSFSMGNPDPLVNKR